MSVEALGGVTFLRAGWLWLLLALPLLAWLWHRLQVRAGGWQRAVDAHLLPHVTTRGRRARAPLALLLAVWTLGTVALAGPAWREVPQPLLRRDAALAIVLELSHTMRAGDLKPDRLTRARFKIADLLAARRDGQFALVVFARSAYTVAPVTDDGDTLLALLDALDPSIMPEPGQNPERGIDKAVELLASAGHDEGDILLIADGVDGATERAAAAAAERGYRVFVLGVGTRAGAPVPMPEGGFMEDVSGQLVLPRLEEDALRAVAQAGGGRYAGLTADRSDLAALRLLDPEPGRGGLADSDDATRTLRDEGPWFVLALLPLVALLFRRGWLLCLPLALVAVPRPALAFDWASLWQRDDQRAYDALVEGEPARARELAPDAALRGAAAYRMEDFEAAATELAPLDDADAHYNRGNALAKAGRYQEALAAYDAALARDPNHEDAVANRKAVEDWLAQQPPQDSQGEGGEGEGEQQPSDQPPQDGEQQDGERQESDQQQSDSGEPQPSDSRDGDPSQDGEAREPGEDPNEDGDTPERAEPEQREGDEQAFSQAMEQALQESGEGEQPVATPADQPPQTEREQAIEQWLRRVPDDPGGLLRRKFALEHQRRQATGEDE